MPQIPSYTAIDALAAGDLFVAADISASNQVKKVTAQQIATFAAGGGGGATGIAGIQFVRATGGSDSNDGLTIGTAKATIAAAVAALPTAGTANGGWVVVLPGVHTVNAPISITQSGVYIVGWGDNRACRVQVGSGVGTGRAAFEFDGDYGTGGVRNLKLISTSTSTHHMGVLVEQAQAITISDCVFQNFGFSLSPATNADMVTGPCAIQIRGIGTENSDWHKIINTHIFQCYRGLVMPGGGSNCKAIGGEWYDCLREAAYMRRAFAAWNGQSSGIASARCWFTDIYMVGEYGQNANYLVRIEADSAVASKAVGCRFTDCETEIVNNAGANWGHHMFIDGESTIINGHDFTGGQANGTPDPPHAIRFGPQGKNNRVGPYTASAQGGGTPYFSRDAAATGNAIWQPSDFTGAATVE
jgi:hypothetical protein